MPNYRFIHKDGREATSTQGTWFAIREALGPDEATRLISSMEQIHWNPIPRTDRDEVSKAELIVDSEVLGNFLKT
jgi:hypothetical protein